MKTACLWCLGLLLFMNVQIASLAAVASDASAAVARAAMADPGALDPKLFLLIGCGLLGVGLVANRRYRS